MQVFPCKFTVQYSGYLDAPPPREHHINPGFVIACMHTKVCAMSLLGPVLVVSMHRTGTVDRNQWNCAVTGATVVVHRMVCSTEMFGY